MIPEDMHVQTVYSGETAGVCSSSSLEDPVLSNVFVAGTEHSALGYVYLKTYEDASEDPNCMDRDLQIAFAFWVGMNLELKDLRGLAMKAINLRMENT